MSAILEALRKAQRRRSADSPVSADDATLMAEAPASSAGEAASAQITQAKRRLPVSLLVIAAGLAAGALGGRYLIDSVMGPPSEILSESSQAGTDSKVASATPAQEPAAKPKATSKPAVAEPAPKPAAESEPAIAEPAPKVTAESEPAVAKPAPKPVSASKPAVAEPAPKPTAESNPVVAKPAAAAEAAKGAASAAKPAAPPRVSEAATTAKAASAESNAGTSGDTKTRAAALTPDSGMQEAKKPDRVKGAKLPATATPAKAPVVVAKAPPVKVLSAPPPEAPVVSLLFLRWAPAASRRMASLRSPGGRLVVVHEGDVIPGADSKGMHVSEIRRDGIQVEWQGRAFLVPAAR